MKLSILNMYLSLSAFARVSRSFQPSRGPRSTFQRTIATITTTRTFVSSTSPTCASAAVAQTPEETQKVINLLTIEKEELEQVLQSWGYPKYRAGQVLHWVRDRGITDVDDMHNLPKDLRFSLQQFAKQGALTLDTELISKDGTRKRAYRLHDGQLIESVLMPYSDGRNTACISSQVGCAMGCVFCATGQSGFARQLTPDEIFEQVSRFHSELKSQNLRLSNVVFMGMGEPLANYRNVVKAIRRITQDLGIGARKITVSTVGIVPNIRKLMVDPDMPKVRLAVSLHNADDEERTELLPANKRYGGLDELMMTLKEYVDTTGRRLTLEWALIEGQNDTPEVARKLGNLIKRFDIRRDMIHVNVIPLNPTGGYGGSPSGRQRVNAFTKMMEDEFSIACTPRMRRGIDIDAGCGQLKTTIEKRDRDTAAAAEQPELMDFMESAPGAVATPQISVYEDDDEEEDVEEVAVETVQVAQFDSSASSDFTDFELSDETVDFESDDYEDPEFTTESELLEAQRLVGLVQNSVPAPEPAIMGPTTSIVEDEAVLVAKKRRKKLLKLLKAAGKLQMLKEKGKVLNSDQREKIQRRAEWKIELESVEHNLK